MPYLLVARNGDPTSAKDQVSYTSAVHMVLCCVNVILFLAGGIRA